MFDKFVEIIHEEVQKVSDHRKQTNSTTYSISDCIMSAFAMFSLKDPSLLSFINKKGARKENLEQIYKIGSVPSENGLRNILDAVSPSVLRPVFKNVLANTKAMNVIEQHKVLGNYIAVAVDGTQYYTSNHTQCPYCMVKRHKDKKTGEIQEEYYHQLLGACIVKPNNPLVFPMDVESISKQDGISKNDCEYNAARRLFPRIKEQFQNYNLLLLLDGLYATGPVIRSIRAEKMDFISVIKEGYVLVQAKKMTQESKLNIHQWHKNNHFECTAKWAHDLVLNGANPDIKVNYIEYQEIDTRNDKITYKGKWITSLPIDKTMIKEFVSVARSRWKIENETFNVLKKKGYNLEHNYGHGKKFLSSFFATLMFLAFLVDQLTDALDANFGNAKKKAGTMRDLRQSIRVLFDLIPYLSMNDIYRIIAREIKLNFSP